MSEIETAGLGSYRVADRLKPAVVVGSQVFDLEEASAAGVVDVPPAWLSAGVGAIIADWPESGSAALAMLDAIGQAARAERLKPVSGGFERLDAPYRPERVFCAASNFAEHANEMGTVLAAKAVSKPYMFLKLRNTIVGPGDQVWMPPETTQLDWEVELAAVIGRRCRRIAPEQALDAVAGYSILNDISARDLNMREDYPFRFDWFQGKCHDTFAPFGPVIVPATRIPDPQAVAMRLSVNGAVMQDDTTERMIWSVREQIAYLSTIVTLEPGDVIATGTPTGVGMGRGVYLKAGDVMSAWIDGIGTLTNEVVAESL